MSGRTDELYRLIVQHCSPTLVGLKTANMFTFALDSQEELRCELCAINRRLSGKGLRVIPLRYRCGKALIYVYRPERLKCDLQSSEACGVLESCGYSCGECAGRQLSQLISRLRTSDEFPHEIGLFLGYPPEDVIGFIERRPCVLSGLWKAYGDPDEAQRRFDRLRHCTEVWCKCWPEGVPLERLTVASRV